MLRSPIIPIILLACAVNATVALAQPDLRNGARAETPTVPGQWDLAKSSAVFERNLRAYLNDVGIKDGATQRAILAYFNEAGTHELFVTAEPATKLNAAVIQLSAQFDKPDNEKISVALAEYEAALARFDEHRSRAAIRLDDAIGFSKNPRLHAALLLIGATTDAPSFLPLEAFYGYEVANLPVSTVPPLPAEKNSVHLWTTIVEPAKREAMERFFMRLMLDHLFKRHNFDASSRQAVLDFVLESRLAREQLEDAAFPVYHALTSPSVFPEQVAPDIETLAAIERYKNAANAYQTRMKTAVETLEKNATLGQHPVVKAELVLGGLITSTRSVVPDRRSADWANRNWNHLYGRNVKPANN